VAPTKQPDPTGQMRETPTAVVGGGRAADTCPSPPPQITSVAPQVLGTMAATEASIGAAEGNEPTPATASGDATVGKS